MAEVDGIPDTGVHVGVVVDSEDAAAYVTNSSTGAISRVALGDEHATPIEIVQITEAEQLGAIAIDSSLKRLFVADASGGRVYTVTVGTKTLRAELEIPRVGEIRALAWSPTLARLFIADASSEVVWSIAPDAPRRMGARLKDKKMREPAGLTVTPRGQVWMVDEGARAAFELSAAREGVTRAVTLN